MKSSLASVSKEKSDLVCQITTATGISNITEEKLEKEINDLKNTFLEKMTKLSGQTDRSILFTKDTPNVKSSEYTGHQQTQTEDSKTGKKTHVKEVEWLQVFMQMKMKESATP